MNPSLISSLNRLLDTVTAGQQRVPGVVAAITGTALPGFAGLVLSSLAYSAARMNGMRKNLDIDWRVHDYYHIAYDLIDRDTNRTTRRI